MDRGDRARRGGAVRVGSGASWHRCGLNNAAKCSEPHGDIVVRATVQGEVVSISVRDTGIGMDPVEIPHLFEKFTRSERVRTLRQGGLGAIPQLRIFQGR